MPVIYYVQLIILGVFIFKEGPAQEDPCSDRNYRVVFYNVENLFHPSDDPEKDDDQFISGGDRRWDHWKYGQKLIRIYKALASVGGADPASLIGLCEIENAAVVRDLVSRTPLRRFNYEYIHFDSPDRRGIDVALVYRPDKFHPLAYYPCPVSDTQNHFLTRDLLYSKGVLSSGDTIHVLVAHWPSRYGGYLATAKSRLRAASITKRVIDSIISKETEPAIILMGDFNDEPHDPSLREIGLHEPDHELFMINISDLSAGSIKYNGKWFLFDQVLVSNNLMQESGNGLKVKGMAMAHDVEFLLEEDRSGLGKKPFRTYVGFSYRPGFSDHLPIYVDLRSCSGQADQ